MTTESSTSFITTLLRRITGTLRQARIQRSRRLALADLLRMPDERLNDFGLNRQDVMEALIARRRAVPALDNLRADTMTRATEQGVAAVGSRLQPHGLAI